MDFKVKTIGMMYKPAVLACVASLMLFACAPEPERQPLPTSVPAMAVPTLAPPVATAQPDLTGRLWIDNALGDIWLIDLASGAVAPAVRTGEVFPGQPASDA